MYEDCFDTLYRITINKRILKANKRIRDIRQLKYPPDPNLVKTYGRCNLPCQSVLYASFMKITSLGELRPKVGDLITISTWKLKEEKTLKYIPIFSNQPPNEPFLDRRTGEIIQGLTNPRTFELDEIFKEASKELPKNLKELSLLVVKFIADFFSKKVNSDNHLNYIFSAYFSDKFFNKVEDGKIDAILYPSVPDKLNSENLAIKPRIFDSIYKLSEASESVVIKDPSDGRGGYGMIGTSNSKNFNFDSNQIFWDINYGILEEPEHIHLVKEFDIDLS
jgi:hypothetical protein